MNDTVPPWDHVSHRVPNTRGSQAGGPEGQVSAFTLQDLIGLRKRCSFFGRKLITTTNAHVEAFARSET